MPNALEIENDQRNPPIGRVDETTIQANYYTQTVAGILLIQLAGPHQYGRLAIPCLDRFGACRTVS